MNFVDEVQRIPVGSFLSINLRDFSLQGELIRHGDGCIVIRNYYGVESIISLHCPVGISIGIATEEMKNREKEGAKYDLEHPNLLHMAIRQIPIGTPIVYGPGETTGILIEKGTDYFLIKELDDTLVIEPITNMGAELMSKEAWELTSKN